MLKFRCCIIRASNCQTQTAEAALWVDLLDVILFLFPAPTANQMSKILHPNPQALSPIHTKCLIPPLLLEKDLSRESSLKMKQMHIYFF